MCVHAYTHRHSAGRESGLWACTVEAAGLCHRTTRASESRPPCSQPLGWVLGERVRPSSVQSPPWAPRIPTEPPSGGTEHLSPCSPKRLAASPPFLPSTFPNPELPGRSRPCLLLPCVGSPHLTETRGPVALCQAPWAMLLVRSLLPGHDPFGTASTPYPQGRLESWSSCRSLRCTWPVPGTIIFH